MHIRVVRSGMRACIKMVMIRKPVLLRDICRLPAVSGKEHPGTVGSRCLNQIILPVGALVFVGYLSDQVVSVADTAVDVESAIPFEVTKRCEPNGPYLPWGTSSLIAPWSLHAGLGVEAFVVWELDPVLGSGVVHGCMAIMPLVLMVMVVSPVFA